MNVEEFRKQGKEMIDYICDYAENIEQKDVAPTLDPGYLRPLLPEEAPMQPEPFTAIMKDFQEKIMPGIVHWNHPRFFAYFPSGNSFPSILGDLLSSAIGAIGFSWASCPASTELEAIVLNWYARALNLPEAFISHLPSGSSGGGGALQGSASECTLVCMITARCRAIQQLKSIKKEGQDQLLHDSVFLPQLIAYASKEAHSSVEKAAKMALVKLRIIETDSEGRMRVDLLKKSIAKDVSDGLRPFFVVATLGTTAACTFDNLTEIGEICRQTPGIWFHVDGAYAGNTFILPEMRVFAQGLEYADSFNTNPNKLLLTNFDASAMWVRDVKSLHTALNVNPLYLQHEHEMAIDFRHYGIPLSRRFRALKLWFVFRTYGIHGLQAYIRNHMALAKKFEMLVQKDQRFEVCNKVHVGLVCFRLRTVDFYNRELLAHINHSGRMHMIPSMVNGKYTIRFCVTYEHASEKDIVNAWHEIRDLADDILREANHPLASPVDVEEKLHSESEHLVTRRIPSVNKRKLTRTKSLRFSFTRSISREMYDSHNEHLKDGCTSILVVDSNHQQKVPEGAESGILGALSICSDANNNNRIKSALIRHKFKDHETKNNVKGENVKKNHKS